MARAAYEAALKYARERIAFGQPIFDHQAVQFRLADMATQLEAARQLIHQRRSAEGCRAAVSEAGCDGEAIVRPKWPSGSAPMRSRSTAATATSATFRSNGSTANVRVCQIYEGTSDIQRILIARNL